MKKLLVLLSLVLVMSIGLAMAEPAGYNWKALIFVGTGMQWCEQKFGITDKAECETILGEDTGDADDKLVMKWSQAWQDSVFGPDGIRYNGDELAWTTDAWENNEWNGMVPDGSGEVLHYMIKWIGTCGAEGTPLPDGGYCIWGEFEVLMDQGIVDGEHIWSAHAIPTGYGAP